MLGVHVSAVAPALPITTSTTTTTTTTSTATSTTTTTTTATKHPNHVYDRRLDLLALVGHDAVRRRPRRRDGLGKKLQDGGAAEVFVHAAAGAVADGEHAKLGCVADAGGVAAALQQWWWGCDGCGLRHASFFQSVLG